MVDHLEMREAENGIKQLNLREEELTLQTKDIPNAPQDLNNTHLKLSCGCPAWGVFKVNDKFSDN